MADLQSQYLKKYRGGSFWDSYKGAIPDSQYYDATGGVHNKSGWERTQEFVFSPQGFALGIGGLAAAPAVAGWIGGLGAAGAAGGAAAPAAAAAGGGFGTAGNVLGAGMLASSLFSGGGGGGAGGAMQQQPYQPYGTTYAPQGQAGSPIPQSYSPYGSTGGAGGGLFNDPTTQPLMNQWATRMAQLNAPAPQYGDLSAMAMRSTQADPRFNSIINALKGMMGGGVAANPYEGQYAAETKGRIAQLHQDPFSSADEANIKARFYDHLERSRTEQKQQVLEAMAQQGHSPTDGAVTAALQKVDQNFDAQRGDATQKLLEYTYGTKEDHLNQALQASQGLAGYGQQEQSLGLQARGQGIQAGSSAANLLADQQNRSVQVAQMLAGLRQQGYENAMSQGGAALTTSALPSELATQRLLQTYQMLSGMAPSGNSIMAGLGGIGNQTSSALGGAQQGNAAMMQQLGAIMAMMPQTSATTPPYNEYHGSGRG